MENENTNPQQVGLPPQPPPGHTEDYDDTDDCSPVLITDFLISTHPDFWD